MSSKKQQRRAAKVKRGIALSKGNQFQQPKQHNNNEQLKGFKAFSPTQPQKIVNNLLIEHPLVFVQGFAGTGKTSGILYHYVKEYLSDRTKKIIVIRTPVEAGPDKIGALPGEKEDKTGPHFAAIEAILKDLMGGKYEADKGKRIQFMIPNYALGMTLNDSLVLIDEAQQIAPDILKMLLERLGQRTTCAVVGDPTQLYAHGKTQRNGLSHAMGKFFHAREYGGTIEYEPRSKMVASFAYRPEDNVRSDISREVVRMYAE